MSQQQLDPYYFICGECGERRNQHSEWCKQGQRDTSDKERFQEILKRAKATNATPDALQLKPTNPKDALGTNRVPLSIVSDYATAEEALAMTEGMLKYGKWNYRVIGVKASIYLDAARRHIAKYNNGEDRDPKTGVHHLGSARACLGVILDAAAQGILKDDRPPRNPNLSQQLDDFEPRIKHLKETFKDHNPKHYTIDDDEETTHS